MDIRERFLVKAFDDNLKLSDFDPDDTAGLSDKEKAKELMQKDLDRLAELQYLLFAENKRSLLIVLQAMDAGGKDGTVRHVMGPLNPQSCRVTSFKAPTEDELAHDFLWRIHSQTPRKGEIRVFNRSHYEDVLIARVNNLVPKSVWSKRYEQIVNFEKMLTENNTHILKFYLHISKSEQLKRLNKRLEDPTKFWKANPQDFEERKRWSLYRKAYDDVLRKTSAPAAPWFVIPANKKWFRNYAITKILVKTLTELKMKFPPPAFKIEDFKSK